MSILAAAALSMSLMTPAVVAEAPQAPPAQTFAAESASTKSATSRGQWAYSYANNQVTHTVVKYGSQFAGKSVRWEIQNHPGTPLLSGNAGTLSYLATQNGQEVYGSSAVVTSLSSLAGNTPYYLVYFVDGAQEGFIYLYKHSSGVIDVMY